MLILIVLIHILICAVLLVLSVHTVFYIFCTSISGCASDPRCYIILLQVIICLTFISTHVYFAI